MTEEIATVASNREFPPGTWVVDDTTSRVGFEVGNLWGLAKVRGEFELVRGVLAVGPGSVDAHLTIDASSLNTHNKRRDLHLRSGDFFDADRYPEILFEISSVAPGPGGPTVSGDLRVGESRLPLSLPLQVSEGADRLAVRTSTVIPRELVGLGWNRLGMIGGEAVVSVELALTRDA